MGIFDIFFSFLKCFFIFKINKNIILEMGHSSFHLGE